MIKKTSRDALRRKRHERIRLRISGSTERPRLSIFRSAKFIYAQVIDDTTGRTLAAASSRAQNCSKRWQSRILTA